jgi:CheY-like chemotaxis protein
MDRQRQPITILMADDDADDRFLTQEALAESFLIHDLRFVEDGEELLAYLRHQGSYSSPALAPRPELILLDLNMPRKDGREALAEIKTDPKLKQIPIVIFTTSRDQKDIHHSYNLGANSFITKPASFDDLVHVLRSLEQYWFDLVELPSAALG